MSGHSLILQGETQLACPPSSYSGWRYMRYEMLSSVVESPPRQILKPKEHPARTLGPITFFQSFSVVSNPFHSFSTCTSLQPLCSLHFPSLSQRSHWPSLPRVVVPRFQSPSAVAVPSLTQAFTP